jgi:putative membrane protein
MGAWGKRGEQGGMRNFIIRTLVTAAAVWATVVILPDIRFPAAEQFPSGDWWQIIAVALIIGVVNGFIRPVIKILTFPVTLLTLGLFGLVINGVMLLVVAAISDNWDFGFTLGGFPPNLGIGSIFAAIIGSIVISIVSTLIGWLAKPAKK